MADRQDNLAKPSSAAEDDGPAPLAPPCAMVIFGAAGDLTKRLVVPALYNLVEDKRLAEGFQLVGVDLAAKTTEEWRQGLTDMMNEFVAKGGGEFEADHIDQTAWRWLTSRMSYLQGDLNDPGMYQRLGEHLAELDKSAGTAGNHLFYLAVADRFFKVVVAGLGAAGLTTEPDGQWRRVVIEKPFGHDLASAKALNAEILKTLQRAPDLSDRPFPGQGNGAEHHGAALRQRAVRADLESRAYRPCPDHRGGNGRRRAPRQVLRENRRAARHGAEPPVPAAVDDGDGAADLLRCRCGSGQEGRGDPGHPAADA